MQAEASDKMKLGCFFPINFTELYFIHSKIHSSSLQVVGFHKQHVVPTSLSPEMPSFLFAISLHLHLADLWHCRWSMPVVLFWTYGVGFSLVYSFFHQHRHCKTWHAVVHLEFGLLYCWVEFHGLDETHLAINSLVHGHSGFYNLELLWIVLIWTLVCKSCYSHVFIALGVELLSHREAYVEFHKKLQNAFPNGRASLYSQKPVYESFSWSIISPTHF